jgi:hypothetical protein
MCGIVIGPAEWSGSHVSLMAVWVPIALGLEIAPTLLTRAEEVNEQMR